MSSHLTQIGKWYRLPRWARIARHQMDIEPLCRMCLDKGKYIPAEVADHIIPHKGDYNLFWFGKLQSLCKSHHDSSKKQIENKGYVKDIGADGFPTDGAHPFNVTK